MYFLKAFGVNTEELAKEIPGPFHTMEGLFREHLEGAMRDLVLLFRILELAISLSLIRNNDLDMSLRA